MGWGVGEAPEGGVMGVLAADFIAVWQKSTQYCKAILLQLNIKKIKKLIEQFH